MVLTIDHFGKQPHFNQEPVINPFSGGYKPKSSVEQPSQPVESQNINTKSAEQLVNGTGYSIGGKQVSLIDAMDYLNKLQEGFFVEETDNKKSTSASNPGEISPVNDGNGFSNPITGGVDGARLDVNNNDLIAFSLKEAGHQG